MNAAPSNTRFLSAVQESWGGGNSVLLRLKTSKAAGTLVVLGREDLKGNKNNISSGRSKRKRKGNGNSPFQLSQMLPMDACALEWNQQKEQKHLKWNTHNSLRRFFPSWFIFILPWISSRTLQGKKKKEKKTDLIKLIPGRNTYSTKVVLQRTKEGEGLRYQHSAGWESFPF